MPIITSILDTDLYKLTQHQIIFHQYPNIDVEYKFYNRNGEKFTKKQYIRILDEIAALVDIKGISNSERNYLYDLGYFKWDYLEYLSNFKFNIGNVYCDYSKGNISVRIKGKWLDTILFEVLILSIINQVYYEDAKETSHLDVSIDNLYNKIDLITKDYSQERFPLTIFEFGTRRRFSKENQEFVVKSLAINNIIQGTSNVALAMKYHLTPIGTFSHEFVSAHQSFIREENSQVAAFDSWIKEYRGNLGIALTDTLGIEKFFYDFDMYYAKLFDGVRIDSGDPYVWGKRVIEHYQKLKINPLNKKIVFSDSLDIPKALGLYKRFNQEIETYFGIGTNLTNDCGFKPLNIVIKMIECDGKPVAKLSSNTEKTVCENKRYLNNLRERIRCNY
jgi:nicotinate phosphoribosyltransferase